VHLSVNDGILFPVSFIARETPTSECGLTATETSAGDCFVEEAKTCRHEAADVCNGKHGQWNADNSIDDRRHATTVRLRCDVTVTWTAAHNLSVIDKRSDTNLYSVVLSLFRVDATLYNRNKNETIVCSLSCLAMICFFMLIVF